jgi:predicted RNase H-like nuclease (RuvC/YqgF family)
MGSAVNFKLLNSAIDQLNTTTRTEHKETSELSTFQGFACLLGAEQENFQNRELLKKAADAFSLAIQYDRSNPAPYLGLAYLFILVKDTVNAAPYLAEARRLSPEHPDLMTLDKLLKPTSKTQDSAFENAQTDVRYESLERVIRQTLLQYLQNQPQPSIEPQLFLNLQAQHAGLQQTFEQLQEQIQEIQAEIDTFELERQINPLQKQLKAFESALLVSQAYLRLRSEILKNLERIEALHQKIAYESQLSAIRQLEEEIEILLDRCDGIADQLDGYHEKGYDISAVEKYYNDLCQKLEFLQDKVEETLEQMKTGVF